MVDWTALYAAQREMERTTPPRFPERGDYHDERLGYSVLDVSLCRWCGKPLLVCPEGHICGHGDVD
jgi:ferredoxin